jgi:hypothetical protein
MPPKRAPIKIAINTTTNSNQNMTILLSSLPGIPRSGFYQFIGYIAATMPTSAAAKWHDIVEVMAWRWGGGAWRGYNAGNEVRG